MLNLTRSNTKGYSSKGTVGSCVTIPTNNKLTWLRTSCFWTNHMYDSLLIRTMWRIVNTKLNDIFSKFINLCLRNSISNIKDIHSWNIMVKGPKSQIWTPYFTSSITKTLKSLRTSHFMNIMLVHVHKLGLPLITCNYMAFP